MSTVRKTIIWRSVRDAVNSLSGTVEKRRSGVDKPLNKLLKPLKPRFLTFTINHGEPRPRFILKR